jgi:tetratricopeptide (TPR) repeat protein
MSWLSILLYGIAAVVVLFVFWSLLGLFSKRVREFQLKLTGTADSPLHLSNQASIESNMGRHEEALNLSDRAIEIDARCKEAWYNRGVALINLHRPQEAEKAFRRAIEIDNRFWQSWNNLAALLQALGKNQEADECMRQAVRLRTT